MPTLRADLTERRLANGRDRDRSALGHLMTSVPSNPLARRRAAEEASAAAP